MARNTKQQAQETRNHIIDAAIERFSEHGVSKTSLADIAASAGVTRGAIYWHFKNKTDLLNEIWAQSESGMADLELEYQSKYPADPLSVMRAMLLYVLDAAATDPRRRALMEIIYHKCEFVGEMTTLQLMQQNLYLECYEKIEEVLQQCIDAKQLPENLNTRRVAVVMRGYISGIMENWLFMPESFDLAADAPQLVDTLIEMLIGCPTLRKPA
ncbi:multidrug efflux transporter transcriptional repressor AcrR [Erwinia aphidicola]|jgi:TetR/AcrR family acrAB operon transcriptional repressor|uniref:Multidrug efflux transporter transcriptional repressor AcrR n=1 Tax=Erwinia aphidicola TaxID=68334 RepID=A0ABU8DBQ8_ERWAP|nr:MULTISPECIES: multidrug efflux transporter transcriptional repressor AcrR [Erwinia]KYP84033.1 transcriptional regulator [bacteria symbiont BFo1 of Frankliniella occidentalis]PIJ53595.1 DNA-binding transcriptional repressor AcrR [Erwinia sp. OLMDLW33]KYP89409.1 transcriptional regulator [bacteria symbiont BFo1 of Frankliniella occidentalis]MBD1376810.1 multidrug efflux transporter transcriptional repressor AcrR [Erwinia aphidicola]MBN1084947.1 multidrug efflux transporter transcriptional rep